MRRQASRIAAIALAGMLPLAASAGTDSGFYLGGAVGQSKIGDIDADTVGSGSNIDFSGTDTAWKAFAGYNFGWVPFLDLAVEGGYVDFGKPDDNGIAVSADGFDLFGLVGVNIGPVGVFGKVGAVRWNADASGAAGSGSDDGTDPAYGLGARFKIGSVEVRAEYEYFDVGAAKDVSLLSAGAAWTF